MVVVVIACLLFVVTLLGLTKGHPDFVFVDTIKRPFVFHAWTLPAQEGVGLCPGSPGSAPGLVGSPFLLWAWDRDHMLPTDMFVICLWSLLRDSLLRALVSTYENN